MDVDEVVGTALLRLLHDDEQEQKQMALNKALQEGIASGFSEKVLWISMYGRYPDNEGGGPIRMSLPYTITPAVQTLITDSTTFLHSVKSINVNKLRPEAVMPEFTQAVLKERGLTAPIGQVTGIPISEYKSK